MGYPSYLIILHDSYKISQRGNNVYIAIIIMKDRWLKGEIFDMRTPFCNEMFHCAQLKLQSKGKRRKVNRVLLVLRSLEDHQVLYAVLINCHMVCHFKTYHVASCKSSLCPLR